MRRVLVVMPSWIGDAVMATPALRLLRSKLPGAYIGALVRPGIDEVLGPIDSIDESHVHRPSGLMSPKLAAGKVRPRKYEAAVLLTNSFSTALVTRLAGIPRRMGYARDLRSVLLTDRLEAPFRASGQWAPVPAAVYYMHAVRALIDPSAPRALAWEWQVDLERAQSQTQSVLAGANLHIALTPKDISSAEAALLRSGVLNQQPMAILNPGGNNPAKRWPIDRFAAIADHLSGVHGLKVLINGSPGETELAAQIAKQVKTPVLSLPAIGLPLGTIKGIIAKAKIMVTNDTGPRHIAAALGVPVVTLFGPTDHRWTTIPAPAGQVNLLADAGLPLNHVADDHAERCRVEHISIDAVREAADGLIARAARSSVDAAAKA
jgi:heptosyltransferase II